MADMNNTDFRNNDLSECLLVANLDAFMFTAGVFEKNGL